MRAAADSPASARSTSRSSCVRLQEMVTGGCRGDLRLIRRKSFCARRAASAVSRALAWSTSLEDQKRYENYLRTNRARILPGDFNHRSRAHLPEFIRKLPPYLRDARPA